MVSFVVLRWMRARVSCAWCTLLRVPPEIACAAYTKVSRMPSDIHMLLSKKEKNKLIRILLFFSLFSFSFHLSSNVHFPIRMEFSIKCQHTALNNVVFFCRATFPVSVVLAAKALQSGQKNCPALAHSYDFSVCILHTAFIHPSHDVAAGVHNLPSV